MKLIVNLRTPAFNRCPRWLKITTSRREPNTVVIGCKLRWWWKPALYWHMLRHASFRVAR